MLCDLQPTGNDYWSNFFSRRRYVSANLKDLVDALAMGGPLGPGWAFLKLWTFSKSVEPLLRKRDLNIAQIQRVYKIYGELEADSDVVFGGNGKAFHIDKRVESTVEFETCTEESDSCVKSWRTSKRGKTRLVIIGHISRNSIADALKSEKGTRAVVVQARREWHIAEI